MKIPICEKCGNTLKGRVPADARITCFFCANPNPPHEDKDDDENDTNWKDKK
jgi:hypothetical protein